jgi:hypothetical protein
MFAAKIQAASHVRKLKNWHAKGFTLVTAVLASVMLIAGTFEFIPAWILGDPVENIHLWHIAELFALAAIFLGGMLLALLREPQEKPLLAQFLVLSAVILAVGIIPFDVKASVLLLVAALFALAYPDTRALLSFSCEGRVSIPILGLTLLISLFMVPAAIRELQWQIAGMAEGDVHAQALHWLGSALLMILLLLAGLLTSTRRPGWKQLGLITGVVYCFLGVIAIILQDGYAGSWSGGGGFFAAIAGVWYVALVLLEANLMKDAALEPAGKKEIVRTGQQPARRTRQLVEV